jgi:hypothetical protein
MFMCKEKEMGSYASYVTVVYRAAAAKCRAKKKMWLDNIESKADEMVGKIRSLEVQRRGLRQRLELVECVRYEM